MSVIEERLTALTDLHLAEGSHDSWEKGACVMEAVAYVAGEPWSDHPKCASLVLTEFLIRWNDSLPDGDRQLLKPYIPRLVGTNTGKKDEATRTWMLTDWLARECAPAWLRLANLTSQAELLERLAPIVDADSAKAAQPHLNVAKNDAAATWAAAWAAARDATWDTTWPAASGAAWDAARDATSGAAWAATSGAAWDATRDAAWAVAWAAAWPAAWAVARAAARPAAWAAAWDAAWDAARAAAEETDGGWQAQYDAAKKAATPLIEARFQAVTTVLQTSALQLLDRMTDLSHTTEGAPA